MKVAAIQMVSEISVDHNLTQAHRLLDQAAAAAPSWRYCRNTSASWAAATATSCCWPRRPDWARCRISCPTPRASSHLDRRGTIPMATDDPERAANASLVYDPKGKLAARYDKIHLFRYDNGRERYDESAALLAGEKPASFQLKDQVGQEWRVGMSVCYDLRFPELYRQLAADILVCPRPSPTPPARPTGKCLLITDCP